MQSERAMGLTSARREMAVVVGKTRELPLEERAEEKFPGGNTPTSPSVGPIPAKDLFLAKSLTGEALPGAQKLKVLNNLDEAIVRVCQKCRLCSTRTNTVFGEGDVNAKIFFIGEGPGENEDLQGRPFVGRAGELLNKMITAMGLKREEVYIANVVKCRPPGNRAPAPDEVEACTPFLEKQLETIRPKVIVTLGLPAMQYMLQTKVSMGKIRGQWHEWRGIKLMPTYHPAYVLRSYTPEVRKTVWGDLQKVMEEIGLKTNAEKSENV
ncbi:MAG TPA: uracil-DNA glycosylase [Tepidisphaeraceae bacterium]|jgi:DNA polymerase